MRDETTFVGFANRDEAGHVLAKSLTHYSRKPQTLVIGLPRGGVVTAAAIAEDLELPLDVLIVRKLGTPGYEELAMGAIGPSGVRVLNEDVIAFCAVSPEEIEAETARERKELQRRERLFRGDRPPLALAGKTVIVVDDGLATGSTMSAAIDTLRAVKPARVVLGIPVAPIEIRERFRRIVDELVCLETPEPFNSVGEWYFDFAQVEDQEVVRILEVSHEALQNYERSRSHGSHRLEHSGPPVRPSVR